MITITSKELLFLLKQCSEIYHERNYRLDNDEYSIEEYLVRRCLLWEELLMDYSGIHVKKAFKEHLKRGKFFPKPAEIIEIIQEILSQESIERERKNADRCMRSLRLEDKTHEMTPEEKDMAFAALREIRGFLGKSKASFSPRPISKIQKMMMEGKVHEAMKMMV